MTQNEDVKLTKFYLVKYGDKEELINTKQDIKKYISNLKRCKKLNNTLKLIINNSYSYIFIEEFTYKTKNELNIKINHIKLLQQNRKKVIETDLNNELYNNSLQYEEEVFILLKNICSSSIIERAKNRYSKFDFYDLTFKNMFELKVNTYSITEYKTAVINIEKLVYPYLILIFGYTEIYYDNGFKSKVNYYFIKYVKDKFLNYNKRYITNHKTGRSSLIIDIPTTDLLPLEHLKLQENNINDFDFFNDLMNLNVI
jgi:hypothetical protein